MRCSDTLFRSPIEFSNPCSCIPGTFKFMTSANIRYPSKVITDSKCETCQIEINWMAIGIFPSKSAMLTFSYIHKQSSWLNCCLFEIKTQIMCFSRLIFWNCHTVKSFLWIWLDEVAITHKLTHGFRARGNIYIKTWVISLCG